MFLDRDGVLCELVVDASGRRAPWTLDELRVDPQASRVATTLRGQGFELVVVSNQPDIGRGNLDHAVAEEIERVVCDRVGIGYSLMCPHSSADHCACRKPAPGMLFDAAERWALDLDGSWMVGDRWVDIAAGRAAGTRTVLIERPYSWDATSSGSPPPDLIPDCVCASLERVPQAISDVLATGGGEGATRVGPAAGRTGSKWNRSPSERN